MGSSPAVALEILTIAGSNTVEVADAVRQTMTEIQRQVPSDVRLTVIRDDAVRIRDSLADVYLSIVLGAVLTIMII